MSNLTSFDISHYLDSEEMIAEYLSQVLSDGDTNEFLEAIGLPYIAKARGISQIAKDRDLGERVCTKRFKREPNQDLKQ